MTTVLLASTNPAKLAAVRAGFTRALPDHVLRFVTRAVDSGVADQPMTDAETLDGARQRARRAAELHPEAGFWVGVEGGVEERVDGLGTPLLHSFAWVVVRSPIQESESRSASFPLPPEVTKRVHAGIELGDAIDQVFAQIGSKRRGGAVGLLTDGLLDRAGLIETAVVLALTPFRRPMLYGGPDRGGPDRGGPDRGGPDRWDPGR